MKDSKHISILSKGYFSSTQLNIMLSSKNIDNNVGIDNGFTTVEVNSKNQEQIIDLVKSHLGDRIQDLQVNNSAEEARYYRDNYWKEIDCNLTQNEKVVIEAIIDNEYICHERNDENLINYPVWTFVCEDSGIKGKSLSGVIPSLTQKGLVESSQDGNDSTIWLTRKGFEKINS